MSTPSQNTFRSTVAFIVTNTKHKKIWLGIGLLLLLYVVFGRSLPIVFGRSIDYGLRQNNKDVFFNFTFLFIGFAFLRATTGLILYYFVGREGNRIAYHVRKSVYSHALNLPVSYHDKTPSGKTLTKLTNDTKSFQSLLGEGLIGIVINGAELASIFVSLILESYQLSVVLLVVFPLSFLISFKLTKTIQSKFLKLKGLLSELNEFLADSLNGYIIITSYKIFDKKFSRFQNQSETYYKHQIEVSKLFAKLWPQIEFVQLLSILLCFVLGSYLIHNDQIQAGTLVTYTLLIQSVFHPLRFILERMNQIQNGITSTQRIQNLLDKPVEEPFGKSLITLPENFEPSIDFDQVSFHYQPKKTILKNINLHLSPNSVTALAGRTGGGKTTLISLIQKFYTPQEGEIFIGGYKLSEISNKSLRKHICVVRQEDFIFSGSLLDNITLEETSKVDLILAQKALNFAEIDKPLDFKIKNSGGNLSLGERQLLSFARIYYRNPKILVFDEATSFIDEKTEQLLHKKSELLFKNKTVLIIAHKKTTLKLCDQVLNIANL